MTALEKYALLEAEGLYFDGISARRHEVIVRFGESTLTLLNWQDEPVQHWALASLRQISAGPDAQGREELRLAPGHDEEERLTLTDPMMIAAIRQVCPDLTARQRASGRAIGKGIFWGALALAAIGGLAFMVVPKATETMAMNMPQERAAQYGDLVMEAAARAFAGAPLARARCDAPEGRRALAALAARLQAGAPDAPRPALTVLRADRVNAITAPGGRIAVLSGLIEAARSPEELAGVLAHELAHAEARDPLRETFRAAGTAAVIGMLIGDYAGGAAAAAMTEAAISGAYRREAEARADDRALEILAAAGLPSAPLAAFFERIGDGTGPRGTLATHLATHPDLGGRAAKARAADAVGQGAFRPALEDADWIALQQICD